MGYYSTMDGDIEFSPPLTHTEAAAYMAAIADGGWKDVKFVIRTNKSSTPEGELTSQTGNTIVSASDGDCKIYDADTDLAWLLSFIPGRTFSGFLERRGEEQGDQERYSIVDGKVVTRRCRIVWDD